MKKKLEYEIPLSATFSKGPLVSLSIPLADAKRLLMLLDKEGYKKWAYILLELEDGIDVTELELEKKNEK